jgi:hypothetical protein
LEALFFSLGVAVAVYAPVKVCVTVIYVPVGTIIPELPWIIDDPPRGEFHSLAELYSTPLMIVP